MDNIVSQRETRREKKAGKPRFLQKTSRSEKKKRVNKPRSSPCRNLGKEFEDFCEEVEEEDLSGLREQLPYMDSW